MLVDVPNNFVKHVIENGGYLTPLLIDPSLTNGTGTTNPSIFVEDGQVYINVRHVEYTLYHSELKKYTHPWGPVVYLHKEDEQVLKTNNFLGTFNVQTKDFEYSKVDTSELDVEPIWEFIGLEDARIVKWGGKFYLSGVRRDTTPHGQGRMELSEVEKVDNGYKEVKRSRLPAPGNDKSYCEKNWMPIVDMPFHYVKWCNPTEVVKVDPNNLTTETVYLGNSLINLSHDLRGGSQVIPYGDDYRIAITHQTDLTFSKLGRKDATYLSRFIVWDRDWNIVKVSNPFNFLGARVEFVCGAAWSPDSKNLMITFGYQDNSAFLLEVPKTYLDEVLGLTNPKQSKLPRVIDYFPYFNEKEVLELRIRTLEDKVDHFIIAEANASFTGVPKEFTLEEVIEELGLPKEKIRIINVTHPEDLSSHVSDIDLKYSNYESNDPRILFWVRERLQKDALSHVINEYNDEDVFIVSDCDEIIRPEMVEMFANNARIYQDKIIKVPMTFLEGRADLQVFNVDETPQSWDRGAVVCTKKHLSKYTVTQLRGFYFDFEPVHITQDGKRIEDAGWHLSWMGGFEKWLIKAKSLVHAHDKVNNLGFNEFNTLEMVNFMRSYEAKEGATNPLGDTGTILKRYPLENLPKAILSVPRLRNYFLPPTRSPVPVLGTAVVNGVHWLEKLVNSVDYPVDEFVVVNNNGRGELDEDIQKIVQKGNPLIKNIKICTLPRNIGCAGAWNLIIKSYLKSPYWIIVNHDVQLGPGILEEMVSTAEDGEVGMVHGSPGDRGDGMYDLFLIKDWIVNDFGLFDENFYPAYDEDVDYSIRLRSDPYKTPKIVTKLNSTYTHGGGEYSKSGSQTWRTDLGLKDKLFRSREINESDYMVRKWGPDWVNNPYPTPFNIPSLPVSTTTFELNFTRSKHLGF